jgi:hypothetical protein
MAGQARCLMEGLSCTREIETPLNTHLIIHCPSGQRVAAQKTFFFVEYVGDYPDHSASQLMVNSGGEWRFTHTQQLDFHVAVGLNNHAPHYIFGLGYSFRFDGLFGGW